MASTPHREIIRVTDDTTLDELTESLGYLCAGAKACDRLVGVNGVVTTWDKLHRQINALLSEWERAKAEQA